MGKEPDIWKQLTREQKRSLQRDLAKHFKLRFLANDAIVRWFRKEFGKDPTMEEVGEIRDRAMKELEPKTRKEMLKSRWKVIPGGRK